MASLFKLRQCISAANFSRSLTASGMFFNVRVAGTAIPPTRKRNQFSAFHADNTKRNCPVIPGAPLAENGTVISCLPDLRVV